VARALFDNGFNKDLAVQIITNTLELNIQDVQMFRSVAYFLMEVGNFDESVLVFERILDLMPGEPHSHLDLALAIFFRHRMMKDPPADKKAREQLETDLRKSADLLAKVLTGDWPDRFQEIEYAALIWLNWVLNFAHQHGHPDLWPASLVEAGRGNNSELRMLQDVLKLDLVVSMAWDTDKTDIDLHVTEPSGELVNYSNKLSMTGGFLSRDFTQGYGPEVFAHRLAPPGLYAVEAKYFASHQQSSTTGATSVVLWAVKKMSTPAEEVAFCMVRLNANKQLMHVLDVRV